MSIQKHIHEILHAAQRGWNRFVSSIKSGIKALYDAIKPEESSFTIELIAKRAEEQAMHKHAQLEQASARREQMEKTAQQKNEQNKSPPKIEMIEPRLSSTQEYNNWSLGIRTESQKGEDK